MSIIKHLKKVGHLTSFYASIWEGLSNAKFIYNRCSALLLLDQFLSAEKSCNEWKCKFQFISIPKNEVVFQK